MTKLRTQTPTPVLNVLVLLAFVLIVLIACTPSGEPVGGGRPVTDAAILHETEWWLERIDGAPAERQEPPRDLRFFDEGEMRTEAEVGGFAGCNYFGGVFVLGDERGDEQRIFPEINRTRFNCDLPAILQEQEEAIFRALENTATLQLTEDGKLELVDDQGQVTLTYTPKPVPSVDPALADTEWRLISLYGEAPIGGPTPTLSIGNGHVGGFGGCNEYGGEIRDAADGTFRVPDVVRTEMDCESPEGIIAQEQAFFEALASATAYHMEDDRLSLENDEDGTLLVFERKVEASSDPASLAGSAWLLGTADGEPPDARRPITLIFLDGETGSGRYFSQSDCRFAAGSYQATEDDIRFPSSGMLGESCPEEKLFLPPDGDYEVTAEQLKISSPQGEIYLYEPLPAGDGPPLSGTEWQLLALVGSADSLPASIHQPLPETTITLRIEDSRVRGISGCNQYFGRASLSSTDLTLSEIEVTEEFCDEPEGVMSQEREYVTWLEDVVAFSAYGSQLWLEMADGQSLLFKQAVD